ncbi:MAG TPA: IS1595 family transposase [Thermoguttaceae bacterium]
MNIIQVYKLFPTEADCIAHLETVRWQGKPFCPYCSVVGNSTPMPKEQRHHCNACKTTFSVTIRTIFHHTHLPLQKWFLAVSLILNAKKGISARQLARDLEVNKSTAWRMGMQIRKAMAEGAQRQLLQGVVEMDETYVGGKPRKGGGGGAPKRGRGTRKTPVVGMIQRGGNVKARVVRKDKLKAKSLSALVREHVDVQNAVLITDEYKGYLGIKYFMPHKTINHQLWYVNGDIHTNGIESFWALLKRGIVGQYHKVSVRHLPQYLNEFCYRFNHRTTADLFGLTIARAVGASI